MADVDSVGGVEVGDPVIDGRFELYGVTCLRKQREKVRDDPIVLLVAHVAQRVPHWLLADQGRGQTTQEASQGKTFFIGALSPSFR